jgi:FAD/FMN-containing dehydrogenase
MKEIPLRVLESLPCRYSTAPQDREHYGKDWSRFRDPAPAAIAFPESIEQLAAIVRWANSHSAHLVISGGRTGLSGGATAADGEIVLSMERMRSVMDFDPADRTLRVQAGITTLGAQEAARNHGLFYPVDFASRGSSQIGGNIATNAGGIKVLRYGLTRDWVAGLKVVTGTGEVLDLNRGLVKNATGYDFRHLFIGSEGTLGIIAEATLRLTDIPAPQQVMVLGMRRMDALMQAYALLRERLKLSAFEFFTDIALRHVLGAGGKRPFDSEAPFYLLAEFDEDEGAALASFELLANDGLVVDGVIAHSLAQNAELWRLREGITESVARHCPYKNDIAVRVSHVPAFLERMQDLFEREYPRFEVLWFGHLGDGNLHVSILQPADMESEAFEVECGRVTRQLGGVLQEFGGSVSAEHGVGTLKKPYLHYTRTEAEIQLMRQVKRIFDPAGILNPGKLL